MTFGPDHMSFRISHAATATVSVTVHLPSVRAKPELPRIRNFI